MLPTALLAFCRLVIGLTFLIALVGKLRNMRSFSHTLNSFRLLPTRFTGFTIVLLLSGEAGIIICMLVGAKLLLPGFLLALGLLLTFSGALVVSIARKQQLRCHCFGANSEQAISPVDLWRNAGFILCALGGYGVQSIAGGRSLNLLTWVLVACIATVFVSLWTQLSAIVQLFREVAPVR